MEEIYYLYLCICICKKMVSLNSEKVQKRLFRRKITNFCDEFPRFTDSGTGFRPKFL
jgi:hypothetical protein